MPCRKNCTCVPREIRDVQQLCFWIQLDLQMLEDRMEAARNEIALPENADTIWDGAAPPTVEIEVHGALGVIVDDLLPELTGLLHRAAIATPRRVSEAWNRIQYHRSNGPKSRHSQDTDLAGEDARSGKREAEEPEPDPGG